MVIGGLPLFMLALALITRPIRRFHVLRCRRCRIYGFDRKHDRICALAEVARPDTGTDRNTLPVANANGWHRFRRDHPRRTDRLAGGLSPCFDHNRACQHGSPYPQLSSKNRENN